METEEKVAELERLAMERSGRSDFGDPHYRSALTAWAHDLLHAPLNDFGRRFLERLVVRNLVARLEVCAWFARHPEIDQVALPPIVMIVGPPRTGTTLLHNLMALHEKARPFLRWELMEPAPPPLRESYATDPRIAQVQASLEGLRGSLLEQMHWVNADEPEECQWGWVDCRGLLGQGVYASMPTWGHHLETDDLSAAYREQARIMRLLLWRNPAPEGSVLLLKSPQTCQHLQTFMDVFPTARLVLTHRDPYRSLLSTLTVIDAANAPFCSGDHVLTEDGRRQRRGLRSLVKRLDSMVAMADRKDVATLDVHYPELMSDPEATVARICKALGLDSGPELPARIGNFLNAQSAGKRAKAPDSYRDLGYEHDEVLADPAIRRYMRRFDVAPERTRLSATRHER